MTLREALGGRWSSHWLLWLVMYPPALGLILVRESTTDYPDWWWPLLSATVQHLLIGLIVVGGGALARRGRPVIPIWVIASLWGLSCVVRAVVGSTVAESVADVPGSFFFRLGSWLLVIAVWGTALIYGIAQIERRRELIGELEQTQRRLELATARATESSEAMQSRLAGTVRQSVGPVLDDLLARLVAVRQSLDPQAFAEISLRLSSLHEETADLVDSVAPAPASIPERPRRASLREIFDVHLAQPWRAAGLVTLATSSLILADAWRIFGNEAALEIVVACGAGGVMLGAVLRLSTAWSAVSSARASNVILSALGAAILVSTWVMLHSGIDSVTWHGAIVLPVLAGGFVASCSVVIAALVLARANADDLRTIRAMEGDLIRLDEAHTASLERERHRLSELMHGPVQGRIAACVMALTFFSTADAAPGALDTITAQVLDHLAAAARDLSLLAEGRPPN
jgi:hypothetical protein